jgi:hypothetical protein
MNSWAKGLKAEKIVGDMFKEAGYEVVKYGYEHTVPELTRKKRGRTIKGKVGEFIRHQPDFIIVNDNDQAFFIEVKFRSNYIKPERDIYPYPNCFVILLDKNYIYAQSTNYLFNRGGDFIYLRHFPMFRSVTEKIIDKYEKKLQRVLGDDTWAKQKGADAIKSLTGRKLVPVNPPQTVKTQRGDTYTTYKGNKYTRAHKIPSWIITKLAIERRKRKNKNRKVFYFKGDYYHYIIQLDGRNKKLYVRKKK